MSPELYRNPDDPEDGRLILRNTKGQDRYIRPSEEKMINAWAEENGQKEAVQRATKGERVTW